MERASAAAFLAGDRLTRRVSEPEPQPRSPAASRAWIDRIGFLLDVDPEGCRIAVDGDEVLGFAVSQNRGGVWYLATYGVVPEHQGQGLGRELLEAVLAHAADRPALFISTIHPGATRRYRRAGFSLKPLMRMVGTVDRTMLPAVTGLQDGQVDDVAWMDRLDRELRGAGHGPDHQHMLATSRLMVSRAEGRRGYVYIDDDAGRPTLLAAETTEIGQTLLWEALAAGDGATLINAITAENEWAVDVGLAAGLDIGQEGYLAVRGMGVPAPYLPSGHFL